MELTLDYVSNLEVNKYVKAEHVLTSSKKVLKLVIQIIHQLNFWQLLQLYKTPKTTDFNV